MKDYYFYRIAIETNDQKSDNSYVYFEPYFLKWASLGFKYSSILINNNSI